MKLRFYIDTCVYGGYYDKEFLPWTKIFFEQLIENNHSVIYSNLIEEELSQAPKKVQRILNELPQDIKELILIDDKVNKLAESY